MSQLVTVDDIKRIGRGERIEDILGPPELTVSAGYVADYFEFVLSPSRWLTDRLRRNSPRACTVPIGRISTP